MELKNVFKRFKLDEIILLLFASIGTGIALVGFQDKIIINILILILSFTLILDILHCIYQRENN